MVTWFKVDASFFQNDRVITAGPDGATVFLQLLALNARSSQNGTISPGKHSPAYLQLLLAGLGGWDEPRVVRALAACTSAGLVLPPDEDGVMRLRGWDETWRPPMTDAERARKARAAKRVKAGLDPSPEKPSQDSVTTPVTPQRDPKPKPVTPQRDTKPQARHVERHTSKVGREVGRNVVSSSHPPIPAVDGPNDTARAAAEDRSPNRDTTKPESRTIEQRDQSLSPSAMGMLKALRERGVLGRKQHALIDLVEQLEREEWNVEAVVWAMDRVERGTRGLWQPTFVSEITSQDVRVKWSKLHRAVHVKAERVDHSFSVDVDDKAHEEARWIAQDHGVPEVEAYEREIARRYAYHVAHSEAHHVTDDGEPIAWSVEHVPARYRRHLEHDGKTVTPLREAGIDVDG